MYISEKMRKALLSAVNDPKNTTGSSHIPFSRYTDKTGTYIFAVLCQKKGDELLTDEQKEIIKNGTFPQQIKQLLDNFDNKEWLNEAHEFLKTTMKETPKTENKKED